MKKGEISINLIIMAVIALIVLVVVIAIFTGRFTIFRGELQERQDAGVSLQDWFEGLGCQPVTNGCETIPVDSDESKKVDNKKTCAESGCAYTSGNACAGESTKCRQFSGDDDKCRDIPLLCKWIPRRE